MTEDEVKMQLDNFTHNVTWLRKRYGYSKKKMAELLRVSVRCISKLEKGEIPVRVNVNILLAVEEHFGLTPSMQLLFRLGARRDRE